MNQPTGARVFNRNWTQVFCRIKAQNSEKRICTEGNGDIFFSPIPQGLGCPGCLLLKILPSVCELSHQPSLRHGATGEGTKDAKGFF
jgi:hypothetical protein